MSDASDVSKETYIHTQKRPISDINRDLYQKSKETYIHIQKRPISVSDACDVSKEFYIHTLERPISDIKRDLYQTLKEMWFTHKRDLYQHLVHLMYRKSSISTHKRDLYLTSKETYIHTHKRPISLSDVSDVSKETHIHTQHTKETYIRHQKWRIFTHTRDLYQYLMYLMYQDVWCSLLVPFEEEIREWDRSVFAVWCSVLQCIAVCCSV